MGFLAHRITLIARGEPGCGPLADDPGETKNVADAHPDIVAKLAALAKEREAEIKKNKWPAGDAGK